MTITSVNIVEEIKKYVDGLDMNSTLFVETKQTFTCTNGEFSSKHDGNFIPKWYMDIDNIIPPDVLERGADLIVTIEKNKDLLKVSLAESALSTAFEYEVKISLA